MNRYSVHDYDLTNDPEAGQYVLLSDVRKWLLEKAKEQFIMSNSDEYTSDAVFAFTHCGAQLERLAHEVGND